MQGDTPPLPDAGGYGGAGGGEPTPDTPPREEARTLLQHLDRVLQAQRISRLSQWDPAACELELREWRHLQRFLGMPT